jgi:prepilin-type N-terminal cleavage/methylation domain-containing protein
MTARTQRRQARAGFTLVELMVAIMVMAVGVLGLAGTAVAVARLAGGATQQTIAANVAATRFEQLRSSPCGVITSGSATTRGVSEKWAVTAAGTAFGVSTFDIVDTVWFTTRNGRTPMRQVYRSYVRC